MDWFVINQSKQHVSESKSEWWSVHFLTRRNDAVMRYETEQIAIVLKMFMWRHGSHNFHPTMVCKHLPSGNQTWLTGKSTINGGFDRNITFLNGLFSSTPCLKQPEGTLKLTGDLNIFEVWCWRNGWKTDPQFNLAEIFWPKIFREYVVLPKLLSSGWWYSYPSKKYECVI